MKTCRGALVISFLLLLAPARLLAHDSCFAIHVRLNGKAVDGPQAVTLKTAESESAVSLEAGCFRLPAAVFGQQKVDVVFTVPGSRIYLPGVSAGFLAGPWDVELEDQRFGSEVALPKHTRPKEACAVIFHVGDPEISETVSRCRTPF
jgi:hypothetical protein